MSRSEEKESLLTEDFTTYSTETSHVAATEGESATQPKKTAHGGGTTGKHARLQHTLSLDKVDEDEREAEEPKKKSPGLGCSDYFGVKSYLHEFYDAHFYKDPEIYEDDEEFRFLLSNPRKRRCTSIWWKVFVWIGANFLVFGIIGVLVGYLVPQRPIVVGSIADNIEIIDREAISFNFNLDVCKLVGLILFCIGGLTLTVALLFPSFLYQYCDEERGEGFKVHVGGDMEKPPLSPLEMSIPVSSILSNVQPERQGEESIVTQEGMVAIKD